MIRVDDRPIVTTFPKSTETPLPRVKSDSSMDSDSTIDRDKINIVEQMMWKTVVSPQCSPFVRELLMRDLSRAHYMETLPFSHYKSSTQVLEMLTMMSTTSTIDREAFDPRWTDNEQELLWWTWINVIMMHN
eukprot:6477242-Amphidinium_carterae.4